ncbi:MAG TPA: hypothetical protein VGH34_20330 [Vicinamibacterales bacterium]
MDPLSTSALFQEFLAQRRYLKNVTPSTIEWYETAFKALQHTLGADPPLTKASLQQFIVSLRQRDVKPIFCNTYIKALNTFCRWLHEEGHPSDVVALAPLKFEKRLIETLTDQQMRLLPTVKPKRFDQWRLHAIVCLLLDAGRRIGEALTSETR